MQNNDLGQIKISNDVVSTITQLSALEVEGASQATSLTDKLFGNNGVKINIEEEKVFVDLIINVNFGFSIPEVCERVQENVINTVETMTGLEVSSVNVHVQGISHKKEKDEQKK